MSAGCRTQTAVICRIPIATLTGCVACAQVPGSAAQPLSYTARHAVPGTPGFLPSPHAPAMPHYVGNRAPERSPAAANSFNSVPVALPAPLGHGFAPPGTVGHLPSALAPGDPTSANVFYDNYQGLGGRPAVLAAPPAGYRAAYSPSDACECCSAYCQGSKPPICTITITATSPCLTVRHVAGI